MPIQIDWNRSPSDEAIANLVRNLLAILSELENAASRETWAQTCRQSLLSKE